MARRARKPLKERARNLFRNQFTCACCPGKVFRGHRALNAHHLSRHGGYWAGQKARSAGRKIGKAADAARRHARGWQEAHGLLDHRGKATAKMRSRPDTPVRRIRDLRARHRHGQDHDRADRHDRNAARHERKGRQDRAEQSRQKARNLRDRHPQRPAPAPRAPEPARTRPARTAPARSNGSRPPMQRPRPQGRLAPANGTRPARTERTSK